VIYGACEKTETVLRIICVEKDLDERRSLLYGNSNGSFLNRVGMGLK
jgi:hypothetical protein